MAPVAGNENNAGLTMHANKIPARCPFPAGKPAWEPNYGQRWYHVRDSPQEGNRRRQPSITQRLKGKLQDTIIARERNQKKRGEEAASPNPSEGEEIYECAEDSLP